MKAFVVLIAAGSSFFSITLAESLAEPPTYAKTWVILSAGGQHGEEIDWIDKDDVRRARMKIVLRGHSYDIDHAMKAGAEGRRLSMKIRGLTPSGDAEDTLRIENNAAKQRTHAGDALRKAAGHSGLSK